MTTTIYIQKCPIKNVIYTHQLSNSAIIFRGKLKAFEFTDCTKNN